MKLERILRANAVFSTLSGASLLMGSPILDTAVGLESWFLAATGAILVGYGALLGRLAATRPGPGTCFATIMDLAWVIGAALVLIGSPTAMTTTGRITLLALSVIVAGFAVEQVIALRGSAVAPTTEPA